DNTGTRPSGDNKNAFFVLTMLTANSEFFGVDVPNVAISNPHDGGNAWTAVKIESAATDVVNPDYRVENAKQVDVIQISSWMAPNNIKLAGAKPYVADSKGSVVYSIDAAADSTKWYEIPAGAGAFGQQVYLYKNVATGAYLKGSTRPAGEGGDWTVSAATTSATNDGTALLKWSKMDSNWGNGPWLVNEDGNTGARPSGDNKNAFFALTMLTANTEFFGVDVPNVAISNPHDGGNAWTAVQINVATTGVINPDYVSDGSFAYSIESLNFFATDNGEDANAASYNEETHTITYKNGGWHRAGWNWETEGGVDVSDFNQVWIKFNGSALPGLESDGTSKIQFDVVYMDDSNAATDNNKTNEIRSNNTEYFYNLTPGKKIKRITLKSQAEGDVVLTDAYFFSKGVDPVDLIVTNVSWTPENPVLGDSILFSATIKNISEFASPNAKHGVTFSVKLPGAAGTGTLLTWSDNHLTSLAPGEEVTVTANGGPSLSGAAKWKPGAARTFVVVAQVNNQNDIVESDITNNILEKEIVVAKPNGLNEIATDGKVFVANSKLYIVNFPESAVVSIYNLQAQEIGHYHANEVSGLALPQNLYIVRIQDGDKSSNVKVLIK
ncbi:MAG: CARDB domain-containing protein, partial [Paludibacter sp.]